MMVHLQLLVATFVHILNLVQSKPLNSLKVADIDAKTVAGRGLLAAATRSIDNNSNPLRSLQDYYRDDSYLADYSIKFKDCHSVSQWNRASSYDDDDDDSDGDGSSYNVVTKRLVRFRLCPNKSCNNLKESGCTSKYGDYIVDISTFLYYYLMAQASVNEELSEFCNEFCSGEYQYYDCESTCYSKNGGYTYYDSNYNALNPIDYAQCANYGNYIYIGPYCSDDGASILMGVFSDETCSTFSSCDSSCFKSNYGFNLPYSSTSVISGNCVPCSYDSFQDSEYDYDKEVREECLEIYSNAGKCETKMSIDYPNESACTFIEGVKLIDASGVISGGLQRNKTASLGIGLLTFSIILVGFYVKYLNIKLSRSKFHLEVSGLAPKRSSRYI